MGQKTHPRCLRLGIVKDWDCNWYGGSEFAELLLEDYNIKRFIKAELYRAGVSRIVVNRKANSTEVVAHVARPGIIFGKNNSLDMSVLKEELKKMTGKDINIQVVDVKLPDSDAKLLSEWVTFQLEKRIPFRRAMKMAVQRCLKSGAKGVKIACSGRLGGVEIARSEWYREGRVPLHTLRADIDYAFSEALTTYGKIGVKVWVYHGEVLPGLDDQQLVKNQRTVEQ